MIQYNPSISGSLTVTGSIIALTDISGTVNGINVAQFSSSVSAQIITVQSATGSQTGRLNAIESFTSSTTARLGEIESVSASNLARLGAVETFTSSTTSRLNAIETVSASNLNRLISLEEKTGSLASTGSNTFIGTQVFTGSVYITSDLIVQGSSSIQNITGSSVNIGTNKVVLNTANPAVRYAGISVIDSGSTGLTGSILWDSTNNNWLYQNPSGAAYTSAKFIAGPQSQTLGSELGLTTNFVMKAIADDHISSSAIYDDGSTIGLKSNTEITGSLKLTGAQTIASGGILITGSSYITPNLNINNYISSGSFPLTVGAYTEQYTIGTNSYKSLYQQSGTAIALTSQISNFSGASAFLIDINAYSSSAATDVYFGATAGTVGNGPANFVIGRRTGTSNWEESFRIRTDGNIGIGTTNPGSKLTIRGTDSTSMLYLGISGSSSNGEAVGITFGSATYDKARIVAYNENAGNAAGYLTFWTGGSPGTTDVTEKIRISSSGYVGIGTTSPGDKLHVYASGYDANIRLTDAGVANADWSLLPSSGTTTAIFRLYNRATATVCSTWTSDGKVGIGTTNPSVSLQVNGDISANRLYTGNLGISLSGYGSLTQTVSGQMTILGHNVIADSGVTNRVNYVNGSWYPSMIKMYYNEGITFHSSNSFGSTGTAFYTSGGTTNELMRISTNGNVGIGITNPSKKLVVNGRMSTSAIVSGNLIAGNIYSNISTSPSYILITDLNEVAGFSMSGKVNAASYTCWNISDIWIEKDYSSTTARAGIVGSYKSGCDFSIVDISYGAGRYVALRFTSNPEIDVMFVGYRLADLYQSDGTATVATSGVTINSTLATY